MKSFEETIAEIDADEDKKKFAMKYYRIRDNDVIFDVPAILRDFGDGDIE